MASAFPDSLMASEGWDYPPEISGTTKGITINFLPDVGNYKEARNQKKFDITCLVCKLQTKIPKNPIFQYATSR